MKKIFLITIGLSIALCADFSRNNDTEIVIDNGTGLQWQDNEALIKDWRAAMEYCEDLTLGSYSDWRLPNINELNSILDDTKYRASISPIFKHIVSEEYWTSTTYIRNYPEYAWFISFLDGFQRNSAKNTGSHVRCVRAGVRGGEEEIPL